MIITVTLVCRHSISFQLPLSPNYRRHSKHSTRQTRLRQAPRHHLTRPSIQKGDILQSTRRLLRHGNATATQRGRTAQRSTASQPATTTGSALQFGDRSQATVTTSSGDSSHPSQIATYTSACALILHAPHSRWRSIAWVLETHTPRPSSIR
jgi:hypothetical protein